MKSMKKIIAMLLAVVLVAACFVGCSNKKNSTTTTKSSAASSLKIGVIEVGDDTESYTKAHSDGIRAAAKALGVPDSNIIWKTKIAESEDCKTAAEELVASGCKLVISNSYGHQDYMKEAADENPTVTFVAMTGDFAAISGTSNLYNAFTKVFEARYVSGVVAGLKIQELINNKKLASSNYDKSGNVKIGYVGAFPYAEVKSGYTAFFLGIQSIVKKVSMEVQYTDSWFDINKEAAAAEKLMADGCVIIGQHADSTGAPAAVENAYKKGTATAYSVGYNVDMTNVAADVALTSPTSDWSVYYKELISAVINGTTVPQDWAKGYEDKAVYITTLGKACADGTKDKVTEVESALKDGSVKVFDVSKFTVSGKHLTNSSKEAQIDLSYYDFSTSTPKVIYQGETKNAIVTDKNGISYFDESTFRAAPYFALVIDGITELNK